MVPFHAVPVLAALLAAPAPAAAPVAPPAAVHQAAPVDRAALQGAMRKLWEDHITWTRLYIVSAVAGLPDLGATTQRLLQNQTDIGDAIKPFYGDAAGARLTGLLRQHILTAAALVGAAKAGNAADVQAASARWDANADSIAAFLSAANPRNWPLETLRQAMHHHLALTLEETQARLRGDWTADVAAYDAIHAHILQLADVLTAGIAAQFPDRVR